MMKNRIIYTIKILIITSFYLFNSNSTFSQSSGWYITPDSPYDYCRFEDISFINVNTGWAIKMSGIVYKTTNGGMNWIYCDSLKFISTLRCVGFLDANTGFIGALNPSRILYKTTNGGFNWELITNIPTPIPNGLCGISILGDSGIYFVGVYSSPAYFLKSTDRGNTWISKSMNDYAKTLVDCKFFSKDSGFAIGSINTFPTQSKAVVLFTSDGGENWVTRITGSETMAWCWKVSFPDRMTGYVSIEKLQAPSLFFKTTDGGINCTEKIFRSSPQYDQEGIGFVNANTGWIGGWSDTTFQTTNGGDTWSAADFGVNVNRFRFLNDSSGYAVGQRIYRYSRGTIGISNLTNEIPDKFNLEQNFPNPFNPTTKINYELPASRKGGRVTNYVSLKVYDVLGNEVATLVNEKQNAGSYKVEFNGSGFSSGIYFYRLQSEQFSKTLKMLLIK